MLSTQSKARPRFKSRGAYVLLVAVSLFLTHTTATFGQTPGPITPQQTQTQTPTLISTPATSVAPEPPSDEYKIGADDLLYITVADAPEFTGRIRVTEAGTIEVPGLSTASIHAAGQTALELAHTLKQKLLDSKQLRDPRVSVLIEEYHGSTVSVLGAVTKPAVYPLRRKTTVLDALSMAQGALPNAGSTVTVVRGPASAEATGTAVGSVAIVDMGRLMKGEDASANIEVRNQDILSVSASQLVYVVGAVHKAGGFVMANPTEGVSVVQAVALAEGLHPTASTHHGLIVRQSTSDHARQEIPVDIALMLRGKTPDVLLAPNDILFIPESGAKQTLKAMGDFALAAATGIAIYGLGYRLQTH